jgi:hypothetical protein
VATATTLSQIDVGRLCFAVSMAANIAESRQARNARASHARPKSVCGRTTQMMPSERTSATVLAHRRGDKNEPSRPRRHRQPKADPRQEGERRPYGGGQACLVAGFRKSRFGDEDDEEDHTRHHHRRGVVDCAHVDQRVIQSVLPARAFQKGVLIVRRHGR